MKMVLLAALAAALVVPPAHAGPTQESLFEDERLLLESGPEAREQALDELDALGVDVVRALVIWNRVAPAPTSKARPAFDARDPAAYPPGAWDRWDDLVREASERGIDVLLNPTGPLPAWASDCGGSASARRLCRPDPAEFGQFVTALGRRYAGVRRWSIWNEPNHGAWLTPQYSRRGRSMVPETPARYRRLVEAAVAGLDAAGHGGDQVLLGETAPLARTSGSWARRTIGPATFYRELFCLDSRGRRLTGRTARLRGCRGYRRLAVAGAAHHPYTRAAGADPRGRVGSSDITIGTLSRLTRWLDRGAARGRVPRGLPIYLTEFGFQSNPPDRLSGVSLAKQARWLNESDWIAFGNSRVRSVAQYELRDERDVGTFNTGLRFHDGRPKPALAAYRMPIWVVQTRRGTRIWGQVRAAPEGVPQPVEVQYRTSSGRPWRSLRTVTVTGPRDFIHFTTSRRAHHWRLAWSGYTSRRASPGDR
jgi:hypothetical protein